MAAPPGARQRTLLEHFFLKPRSSSQEVVAAALQEGALELAAKKEMEKQKLKRGSTPWAAWSTEKKQKFGEELASGMSWSAFKVCVCCVRCPLCGFLQTKYANEVLPPESTLRGWKSKTLAGQVLLPSGRPTTLDVPEELAVMDTLR